MSDEWICDGPYSWSEPAKFCGTSLWTSDAKIARGRYAPFELGFDHHPSPSGLCTAIHIEPGGALFLILVHTA